MTKQKSSDQGMSADQNQLQESCKRIVDGTSWTLSLVLRPNRRTIYHGFHTHLSHETSSQDESQDGRWLLKKMILADTIQTVDSAPWPFCLMHCTGKWVGPVQCLRSLNEDTAQEQLYVDAYMFLWWSDAFKKRLKESSGAQRLIDCFKHNSMRPACLPSLPGRVTKLRLVQRLALAAANAFRVP